MPRLTLVLLAALVAAAPVGAHVSRYGGIGASVASFHAAHQDAPGKPPAGATYYRIDKTRGGRVWVYHVVVGWESARSPSQLLSRLTGTQLPADATSVKPYNGYCAVYRSSWLERVMGLPYIVVYVPEHQRWWTNGATASRVPLCRG